MAYYRMSGSSKGELHGASVLVTVDGEIESGDTVTLTKTGYSQTKTLSDVKTALFTDILDSGTYTATYKTFSNTVEVSAQDVLDKTTKNVTIVTSTTITLTIEGAKEDNIKIYDSANTQVGSCVFASGQTTGTVDLEIPLTGGTYKFESTVAKDTETGTSNYSKNVSLTNSTTSVKCMPEGSLYWYGNEYIDLSNNSMDLYHDSTHYQQIAPEEFTNYLLMSNSSNTNAHCGVGNINELTISYSKIKAFIEGVTPSTGFGALYDSSTKALDTYDSNHYLSFNKSGLSIYEKDTDSKYFYISATPPVLRTLKIYALWLE